MAVAQEVRDQMMSSPLAVTSDKEAIARDLGLDQSMKMSDTVYETLQKDPELQKLAREHAAKLIASASSEDAAVQMEAKSSVDAIGLKTQQAVSRKSAMLKEPVRRLMQSGEDGGLVGKSLVDLTVKVESLDPNKVEFAPGWFPRWLGWMPFVGLPLKKYFLRFESSQTLIAAIMNSLEKGREQLQNDNVTLAADQADMRNLTRRLEKIIAMVKIMEKQISQECDKLEDSDSRKQYLQEEILFPIRQRIIDLQTQLTVNLQGILSLEIIIRNNRELIRGVLRAQNVTVQALEVAVTVAVALAHQRIVLDKITQVNKTTDDIILATAQRLKTQGVDIHKQASTSMLNMDKLKKSFELVSSAMDDVATFRREALPQMASLIVDLDHVSAKAEDAVTKMERGNRGRQNIIDLPENM